MGVLDALFPRMLVLFVKRQIIKLSRLDESRGREGRRSSAEIEPNEGTLPRTNVAIPHTERLPRNKIAAATSTTRP